MIITCPSCGASFNIKPEALGPKGRSVKCSKCAHRWHATAEAEAQTVPAAEAAPETEAAPEAAADAAPPEPAAETDEAGEAPQPADASAEDRQAADEDAVPAPAGESDETEPEAPPPGMAEALGLAAAADTAADGAETSASRSRRRPKGPARRPRKSLTKVLSIFVVLLVVCGTAAGAAVFMKREIMMWLPATQRLYAMIGMQPKVLGQGLQIVEPKPTKEIDGSDEILVVNGEIRNVADQPVEVPLMRGALLDKTGKELHAWTFTAAKSQIEPGGTAQYRTEFRNPPTDAQSLDITFTRADAAPAAATHDATLNQQPGDGMMKESTAQQH